jgi:hypothetical protein
MPDKEREATGRELSIVLLVNIAILSGQFYNGHGVFSDILFGFVDER